MIAASDRLAYLIRRQADAFDRLVRSSRSPETVHRLRVLTRRLRAALSAGRRLAPSGSQRKTSRRLRRLGRALGERRQVDVAIADYAGLTGGRRSPELVRIRAATESALSRRLRRKGMQRTLAALRAAADEIRLGSASDRLDAYLDRRATMLRDALTASSKKELHALRIEAKKTRYALEVIRAAGRAAGRSAGGATGAALKTLQRRLGRVHDYETLRKLLPKGDPVADRAAALEAERRRGLPPAIRRVRTLLNGDGP